MTATAARRTIAAAEQAAGLTAVAFHTLEAVEIAHVGENWAASTGTVTLTMQHLQDAVTAAADDPHILVPRLKIGHTDPRFNEADPVYDPFAYHGPLREDGNPVYGKVANLRLVEDGMTIVGDYVEVPGWLYDALPSSYPSRSLEGTWDVETEGGKRYSFVITAVALLGEPLPAISCLEDLVRELTGGPEAVAAQTPVTLRREAMPVAAEASVDAVREQFWNDFAIDERYWWWPIETRVDEGWILADDDEGHLYRIPFTVDADGAASFGDPEQGVLDFRGVTPADEQAVAAGRVARFSTPAAAGRPKDRVRAATDTNERSSNVDISTLREQLEMPDATEDEVIAAATERIANPPATEAVEQTPIAASNDKTVAVDREQFAQMQHDAELGRKAHLSQLAAAADKLIDTAKKDGRLAPASASAWRTSILPEDATELVESEVAALAALEKGRIPVEQRGTTPAVDAAADQTRRDRVRAALGHPSTSKESN